MEKKNVYAGTGISQDDDPYKAGKEAVEMAIEKAGKSPEFGVVFCSGGKYGSNDKKIQKLVDGAHDAFMAANKNCKWIGCTTGGEISNKGINRKSVIAMAVKSDYIRTSIGIGNNVSKMAKNSGKMAAKRAMKNLKLDSYVDSFIRFQLTKKKSAKEIARLRQFVIITLMPGFTFKKSGWEEDALKGIKEVVGIEIPVVGGSAADDSHFIKNYQFSNGKVYDDAVICLAVFSNLKFGLDVEHGYFPTNKMALVTKAKANKIYKLNNRPSLYVYANMLGVDKNKFSKSIIFLQKIGKFPNFIIKVGQKIAPTEKITKTNLFFNNILESPLAVIDTNGDYWLKVPKGISKDGALEFYNSVEKGNVLVLMKSNKKKYIESGAESVKYSVKDFKKGISFSLFFECLGRYIYLGKEKDKSFKNIKKITKESNLLGFYTSCEIGSSKGLPSFTHTYTCSSISFSNELIT